jgi:iron-sulfur cluster assembly transcription factor IscR
MARKMTEGPTKRRPITKIMPSDACKGDTSPLALGLWYDFHDLDGIWEMSVETTPSSEAGIMQLSTKGRYAVMAMADLAKNDPQGRIPLAAISERQMISLPYLEQLFLKLRRAGLVEAVRGPGGGYALTRGVDRISIAEIMHAVDEPVTMTRCRNEDHGGCVGDHRCLTHDLWAALGDHILTFLDNAALGDVVANAFAKEQAAQASASEAPELFSLNQAAK